MIPSGYTLDAAARLIPSERVVESAGMTEAALAVSVFETVATGSPRVV